MEDLMEGVFVGDGRMVGILDLREVAKGLDFSTLHMMNPTVVGDFKHEHKAQNYFRIHQHAFGCDPINSEVMWCLES